MHVCVVYVCAIVVVPIETKQIKSNQMILMERLTILQSIVISNQINVYDDAAAAAATIHTHQNRLKMKHAE